MDRNSGVAQALLLHQGEAALEGCSLMQPRDAGPPSWETWVVPWMAKLPS